MAFPDDLKRLFAFSHRTDLEAGEQLSGWALYQPRREFERGGTERGGMQDDERPRGGARAG